METETQWTLIRSAQGEGPHARRGLDVLIRRYQGTILRLIRKRGVPGNTSAEDLLQSFLTRAWKNHHFDKLDPALGSFHGWLYRAVSCHVANAWRAQRTDPLSKGQSGVESSDDLDFRLSHSAEAPYNETPADTYVAEFVSNTLEFAFERLRVEYEKKRSGAFEAFAPFLLKEEAADTQECVARRLGLTRTNFATELHRLRGRWRHLLEIALGETVEAGDRETQALLWAAVKARKTLQ
jgi:RNA polymerase sigma factor (sigma-70 family)